MIPIKLSIEGLYSYQAKQTINFETLTSDKLFGIFGSVGSGKSSILEAITFCLYGKTDRLLQSGDNRNYNMMNLKSNQMYIEFDFWAGDNNTKFRSVVSAKRNSKRHEDVKKIDRIIYQHINSEFTPISSEELEKILGLSYDNFKRTIIIPQGKFQDFLQLGDTERTRMMKDLFNLEKFELAPKLRGIESDNLSKLQITEGQLKQLEEVNKERVNLKHEKLDKANKELLAINKNVTKIEVDLKEFDKLNELFRKLNASTEKLNELEKRKSFFDKLKIKLQNIEYCNTHFKNNINSAIVHQNRIDTLNSSIDKDTHLQATLIKKETIANESLKLSKEKHEKIDTLKKEAEQFLKLIEIQKYKSQITSNKERLSNGRKAVDVTSELLSKVNLDIEHTERELDLLKKQLPNLNELSSATEWHVKNNQIKTEILDLKKEDDAINIELKSATTKAQEAIANLKLDISLENWQKDIEALKNVRLVKLNSLRDEFNNMQVQQKLISYSEHLHEGDNCPLCGSIEHPNPIKEGNIRKELESLKLSLKAEEQNIAALDDFIKLMLSIQSEKTILKKQLKRTNEKKCNIENKLKEHATLVYKSYQNIKQLNDAQDKLEQDEKLIKAKDTLLKEYHNKRIQLTNNKEKYVNALHKIETELEKYSQSALLLEQQIEEHFLNQYKAFDSASLQQKYDLMTEEIVNIENQYKRDLTNLEQIKLELEKVSAVLSTNKKSLKGEEILLTDINNALQVAVTNSPFKSISDVKGILADKLDITSSKEELNQYIRNSEILKNELDLYKTEIGNKEYNKEKHKLVKNEFDNIKQKQNELFSLKGTLENQFSELKKSLAQKEALQQQNSQLKQRNENINTLKKLFKSSGFVNYVSSVYLQNICAAANDRFYKMTRHNLSLELNSENNFEVRDHLNGGKVRNVKTLSGGQTFQAALALALALSDNIQSKNQSKQNFFFLDEGFGSLDKAALDMVFNTLKSLRKENRIVGVISHVEELKQEISSHLRISQNQEDGSYINCSWEE